jgi:hypothetical protein
MLVKKLVFNIVERLLGKREELIRNALDMEL